MDDHLPPQRPVSSINRTGGQRPGLGALGGTMPEEEIESHWEEDPADMDDSDPEHARRLAAIRTELLRRSQLQRPTEE